MDLCLEWLWIYLFNQAGFITFTGRERLTINRQLCILLHRTCTLIAGLLFIAGAQAQMPHHAQALLQPVPHGQEGAWGGVWAAEDSPFVIRVIRSGNEFTVESIESMGLRWVARNGIINGDSATIEVEYQGVYGRVLVQLIDATTAVARAMSCQPDYHVICALVRNQQARFNKQIQVDTP